MLLRFDEKMLDHQENIQSIFEKSFEQFDGERETATMLTLVTNIPEIVTSKYSFFLILDHHI